MKKEKPHCVHVCNGSGSLSNHLPTRAEQGEQWRHTVRKDEMKFSLHFFLFQPLSKSSHNHIPHFRHLFLSQQNLFSLSFTATKQRHYEIHRDTQQKEKQKKTQVERIFVQIFFSYSDVFSASKQRERTWLHADQNLKSHRFFNFLGNQTGSNSKAQSIRVGTYSPSTGVHTI